MDTGFGGSYRFMQQLQKWFQEHMPAVTTIRKRKPGFVFADHWIVTEEMPTNVNVLDADSGGIASV